MDTRRRILLIDDDPLQHRLAELHFRKFRGETFELDWESTYEGGLARLVEGGHAACLLDYQLGERDGLELIREAMARGCRTPIVFLTAESSREVDILAMNAGALDYLVKGEITPAVLERSLRYALKLGETLESLHRLATHDELTGLFNRREFERIRQIEEARARETGGPLALAMLDLDRFKEVNDRHGHAAGDRVLREVARRIRGALRLADPVARIGGDEFAVLLVGASRQTARAAAERLREAISREPVRLNGGPLALTVSVGLAVLPEDVAGGGPLFAAADKALYRAKLAGRDRVGGGEPR